MRKLPILGILGGILLTAAVLAVPLGLDNDAGWGMSRVLLAAIGFLLITTNWIAIKHRQEIAKIEAALVGLEDSRKVGLSLAIVFILISGVYFWYGTPAFENPEFRFDYYGKMATAFKHGQVHLLEEPPPSLLALSDPYDYALRYETGVVNEIPIDITLYKGKYYLYWGPAPSLFLIPFTEEVISQIKDKFIGYFFACGVLLYLTLFIFQIWKHTKPSLPNRFTFFFTLVTGLSIPALWMIKTSGIYEAAIFSGQFFFIGGYYWLYCALSDDTISKRKLLLGGIHWAFAMGTRLTVWPAILLGAIATLLYLLKDYKLTPPRKIITSPLLFALPPFAALLLLGWYNYSRFDSVADFGLKYQLANTDYRSFTSPFASYYIKSNLHNYFTYPVAIQEKFPFIKPTENTSSNERLAGLIYTSPWILFFIIPLLQFILSFIKKKDKATLSSPEIWFLFSAGGGSAVMLSLILMFYFPATRYIEDFTPSFFLLSFFLTAKDFSINHESAWKKFFLGIFTLLGIWSIVCSLLISLPVEHVVKIVKLSLQFRNILLGFGIGG